VPETCLCSWALDSDTVDSFCVARRKALRRFVNVLNLPYNTPCYLLPIITNKIPIFDELCKRFVHFITSYLSSPSRLFRSVSWHSVVIHKFSFPIGTRE
jgi:hypothetical protein